MYRPAYLTPSATTSGRNVHCSEKLLFWLTKLGGQTLVMSDGPLERSAKAALDNTARFEPEATLFPLTCAAVPMVRKVLFAPSFLV